MFTLELIDICPSDYLLDHHNRPGESLIGVSILAAYSMADLQQEILESVLAGTDCPMGNDDLAAALERAWSDQDCHAAYQAVASTRARAGQDSDSDCQAWFLLRWDV